MKRLIFLFMIIYFSVSTVFLVETASSASDFYQIGIDDILQIRVLDHDELSTLATVTSDGTIVFPYIGSVVVKGRKISDVEAEITKRLTEGYIKYPVVTVSLMKSLSRKIYSYGEVSKRGEIPFEEGMTIIKAMSAVGGVSQDGLFGKLVIRRKQGNSNEYKDLIEADIDNGFIHDRKIEDISLKPDDILLIEPHKTFLIQGEVRSRGRFVLQRNMTVLKALLEAGGVTPDGMYGKIRIRRKKEGVAGGYADFIESGINNEIIENKEVEDILVKPDDILIVERGKTFLIEGEVIKTGRYVIEKDVTILRALLEAGGVTPDGMYGKIKLRRKGHGGYADIVELKLSGRSIEGREVEDTLLEPDDILIVQRNKTFFIYGEVNKTGEFVLTNDMSVFKAITIAGGFTKWGAGNRVKILRSQKDKSGYETIKVNIDDVIKGNVEADVLLHEGDTIVVSQGIF